MSPRSGRHKRRKKEGIRHDIPIVIASFLKAYPNANYFGLGRDSFQLMDAIDATMLRMGKLNRVGKLPASVTSFTDKNNPNDIQNFLIILRKSLHFC